MKIHQLVHWRVVAVSLAAIFLFIAYLNLVVSSPSDGAHLRVNKTWQQDGIVAALIAGPASGLKEGDLIIAIDGRSIESLVDSAFTFTGDGQPWRIGDTVTYSVVRNDGLIDIPVTLAAYPLTDLLKSEWGSILTTLSIFVLASFIFLKRPHEPAARVFFLAGTAAVVALTWSFGPTVNMLAEKNLFLFYLVTNAAYLLFLAAFVHFALVFPKTPRFVSRRAWIIPSLYLIPLTFLIVFGIVAGVHSSSTLHLISRYVWAIGAVELMFGPVFLVAVYYSYRTARDPISRLQARWVLFSFGIVSAAWVVLMILPEIFLGGMLIDHQAMGIVSLIIPISLAIAILRYRLFDIDIIINRTIVYGLLTAGVIVVYVLVVAGVGAVLQTNSNLTGLLLATILAGLLVRSFGGYLQRGANRLVPIAVPGSGGSAYLEPDETADYEIRESVETANSDTRLTVRRYSRIIRIAWYLTAVLAVVIIIASIPSFIVRIPEGLESGRFAATTSPLMAGFTVAFGLVSFAVVLLCLSLATLLFRRGSDDRMGLILSFYFLVYGVVMVGPVELLEFFIPGIERLTQVFLMPLFIFISLVIFAVLPDGRFVPKRNRWIVLALLLLAPITLYVSPIITSPPYTDPMLTILVGIGLLLALLTCGSVLYGQIFRYRNVSTRQQKQQIKWIAYGFGICVVLNILSSIPWIFSFSLPPSTPYPLWLSATSLIWLLSAAVIPISLTVAVMRYRLYDIDILINRTLVFGAITALIVAMYILVVGGLGAIFQSSGSLLFALLATGLAALLAQPLRERLQGTVNRMMYGERDDPYAVLTRLGTRLEAAVVSEDILPTIVETIAITLKLPYVAISLDSAGTSAIAASYGKSPSNHRDEYLSLPLVHQGDLIGQLIMARRDGAEPFSQDEERLLEDISRQVEVAAHNVRLTGELQISRARLVTAREEERRRLRRDLHDGLGPTLASQTLKLDAALDLVDDNPEAARALLLDIKSNSQETVSRIRRLVYDLRPPALDDLGLVGALQAHIIQMRGASNGLAIDFVTPEEKLPPLPAAIEVAAYRIVQEGLTNVVRHAAASQCRIEMSIQTRSNQALQIEIEDDGVGLPSNISPGVGIKSMRERAAELGGFCIHRRNGRQGTSILAQIPIHEAQMP